MSVELNNDQKALVKWLTAGLEIEEVRALHGDSGYLLSNMIAKVTLAADKYFISTKALEQLKRDKVDLTKRYKRAKFYGKKSPYVYEHTVPASLVRARLLSDSPLRQDQVVEILSSAGDVAMILREEDKILSSLRLGRKMPEGWDWGDDPFARYKAANIDLSNEVLLIEGPICR